MLMFAKAAEFTEDPAERLNRLLDEQEAKIATVFRVAVADLKDDIDLDELATLIEQGRVNEAIDRLKDVAEQLAASSNVAFLSAGQAAADFLRNSGIARIVFDQVNLNAVAAMQANRLTVIREFTDEQRKATSVALIAGVEGGTNPRAAARNFRDSIGLTTNQWNHVANYRRVLERVGSDPTAATEAISRALRDGRGDKSVQAAARAGRPLPPEKIDWLVKRYSERYVKHRAEVIGRTEALRAVNQGNHEAYRQAIASGQLTASQIEQEWRTRIDSRERATHRYLNGVKIGWGEVWVTENGTLRYPGDPAAPAKEVIQCRCAVLTRIRQL